MAYFDDELYHYGTKRHSGRYPWGSGENPYQHEGWNIMAWNNQLRKEGYSETERAAIISERIGRKLSTTDLRAEVAIAKSEKRAWDTARAWDLKQHGYSNTKIGEIMGINESSVRGLLDPKLQARASQNEKIADILKQQVEEKKYLDVTSGAEYQFAELTDGKGNRLTADIALNVNASNLKTAVAILEKQGYKKHYLKVEQAGNPGHYTTVKVLTKGDVPYSEVRDNRDKILSPGGVYIETGNSVRHIKPPLSIDSKRVAIRYAEDGGADKDGVIELRRGVSDISLGRSQYAQVRIAVDGTHYIKGMAMYNDNLPKGVDILFNTNKHKDVPKMDVLKKIKDDPDNPFGATVRQIQDDKGNVISACNIVNDDSDWGHWSRNLSSQMLSKQTPELAKRQLGITYSQKKQEYDEICSLTNDAVKRRLLESFADSCDSSAVHLKAAALPRQETKVILPLTKIKNDEVYAPTFYQGEKVALVRYPHGGIFEMPVLTVNNRNPEGRNLLKQAPNAIGINSNVAQRLSGADFDGDTVIVIPLKNQKIKTSDPLKELKGFDPSESYPNLHREKVKDGVNFNKQMEMGKVSNLITDMTLQGANPEKIARAVKHSMVVIDAEKHNLDWQLSEERNGIKALKEEYQGGKNKGAATLISKASSETQVPERKDSIFIDKNTGEKIQIPTDRTYTKRWAVIDGKQKTVKQDKDGSFFYIFDGEKHIVAPNKVKSKEVKAMQSSTKMAEEKDAYNLSSGTVMESIYAEHANKLKALANQARKEYISTPIPKRDPAAAKTYSNEVNSLYSKLNIALKNTPRERQAQLMASKVIEQKIFEHPELKDRNHKEDLNKVRNQALAEARARAGSISRQSRKLDENGNPKPSRAISISDKEWEAIQAGAISGTKLNQILQNTDLDAIKERAMPKTKKSLAQSKLNRAKAMLAMGYTQSEVAEACGISVTTMRNNGLI